ncbi:MAG: hypothetical protein JWQ38_1864 [Flavipsychrobacter sp.]|nr:hypothetical protein [Flavipsychrobacter sp.]
MKLLLLVTILFHTFCATAWAQSDTISCKKHNFPTIYKMNGKNIWSINRLQKIVKNDAEASPQIRKGKRKCFIGAAFYEVGIIAIISGLGSYPFRNDGIRPAVIAVGTGFLCASIPLSVSSGRKIRKGVKTYNRHINERVGR